MTTPSEPTPCGTCGEPFKPQQFPIPELNIVVTTRHCPACSEKHSKARQLSTMTDTKTAAERKEAQWANLCPAEFRTKEETNGNTDLYQLVSSQTRFDSVLRWKYGSRGLIVCGLSGGGKTRTVWRLIRRLFDEGKKVVCLTPSEFERQFRDASGTFTLSKWFDNLVKSDVVFIDDLGKGAWSDATKSTFFDFVDARTKHCRPMIITTNFDRASLQKRIADNYGEPLIRRLVEYCDTVTFNRIVTTREPKETK